jgi:hypothetical protein
MTVVGYGDVYPQTLQGKLVGMMTLAFAPLLLALPMSIIVNQFQTVYNELQSRAPVNVSKLPLSSRLRAQLRTRWQARMEMSEQGGLRKKEVIPASPVKSGHSPGSPRARARGGNSPPSIAGRPVHDSHVEDRDGGEAKPSRDGVDGEDRRPSLLLTVDDYEEDEDESEQDPILARVSVVEAKVDQAYELTTRALEVMRAAVALAAEGGEKARELQLATISAQRYEKGGALRATTAGIPPIAGAGSRSPVAVSRSTSAAKDGPSIPLVGDPPPPENHAGQPGPDQKDLDQKQSEGLADHKDLDQKQSEGPVIRETQWSL